MIAGLLVFGRAGFAQTAILSSPAAATGTAPVPPACTSQGPVQNWDAAAKLIAGIDGSAYTPGFTDEQNAAWSDYAKTAAADWRRLKVRYVDRIAAWRTRNLQKSPPTDFVFYPFSGPDATNALAFYPDAREYVLVGLEPVGCIPSKPEDFTPEYWPALRQAWQSAVVLGFFKTEEMEHDLGESGAGVLPVLLFLISRAGNTIVDVTPTGITSTGQVVTIASLDQKVETRGVTIQFRNGGEGKSPARVRTLRYFASNLRDTRMQKKIGTTKYLESMPAGGVLVKSASYLMHKKYFSRIRGIILAKANVVIEDDSGIPFHYFDPAVWDVRLFGTYDKPIKLFESGFQEDLKTAYDAKQNVQPLDFGISYKFRVGESNLMLAVRKGK